MTAFLKPVLRCRKPVCSIISEPCCTFCYNKYGDHDPNGLLYVLKEDAELIEKEAWERFQLSPPQPYEEVQPLVLRANVGDEIHINFYNLLNRRASIHVQGLEYNVSTSDGASIGFNLNTTTDDFIQYTWYAAKEGVFLFSDMADTRSGELGTNVHGLFGAIIVEKASSSWFHPATGEPLKSGLFADVYHPSAPAFREYAVFFHSRRRSNAMVRWKPTCARSNAVISSLRPSLSGPMLETASRSA